MTYMPVYDEFILDSYRYDANTGEATFSYSFDNKRRFSETLLLTPAEDYDKATFDRVMRLAHGLIGISYYKTFPAKTISVQSFELNAQMADFFSTVYKDGLSQFVYENNLTPNDIGSFIATSNDQNDDGDYHGSGTVVLQSGGKDSLLVATLLKKQGESFDGLYCTSGGSYPKILNTIGARTLHTPRRRLDSEALKQALADGGLNGHVPITFIIMAIGLLQAVLENKATVLVAAGQEGEEPHAYIGEYAIRHQWSKTWEAEQLFARYVAQNISPAIRIGSPLRGFSELKIAQLFAKVCWEKYGHDFSSCNVANYQQGQSNETLRWCGNCSKCANSFLLFAPFVEPFELIGVFGSNLFMNPNLQADFKGLLGVENAIKPFECVGEVDELRYAYHRARQTFPAAGYHLGFDVPASDFDVDRSGPMQEWARALLSVAN